MLITPNSDLYSFGAAANHENTLVSYCLRNKHSAKPIKIIDNVADVSMGKEFTLALLTDG